MAHAGQAIANPVTGERVVFRATAADTDGHLLSMDYHAPAQHLIGPLHIHPRQEERSEVVAGNDARTGRWPEADGACRRGSRRRAWCASYLAQRWRRGASCHRRVSPGPEHRDGARGLVRARASGSVNRRGMPAALQMAVLMSDHLDEMAAPLVPLRVQRAMLDALAAIARRRGYRSEPPPPLD